MALKTRVFAEKYQSDLLSNSTGDFWRLKKKYGFKSQKFDFRSAFKPKVLDSSAEKVILPIFGVEKK
ncbi:hypothetical protein [Aquimarina brevivitae]|uniref:hypothetical protein n=1 Tax=Aquimarina brevivitae TaxID=323412 RepID=UPI001028E71F|nr:hypothetical protein [Aquimarina brevivitae]